MMEDFEKAMKKKVAALNAATVAYDAGHPFMTDKEWDRMYFSLQSMEKYTGIILPDSPTQKIHFETVSKLEKVTHKYPMLSLNKTKSWEEVENWIGGHPVCAMLKMDGLTGALTYRDGKLVAAETRGDGYVGENIFHNIRSCNYVPFEIEEKEEITVHGEIICELPFFYDCWADTYANARNFAAGSIRLLDGKENYLRNLSFVAWDVIGESVTFTSFKKRLDWLEELGFTVVPAISELVNMRTAQLLAHDWRNAYPIDGLVFRYDDIEYGEKLGNTAHHFNHSLAFKFADESMDTFLANIEWSMGRTGKITPVAIFAPVELEGSTVSRASLHNLSVMKATLGDTPQLGQPIKVIKSNMIIPQISWADQDFVGGIPLKIPSVCPCCGKETIIEKEQESEVLKCNNRNCPGQFVNKLDHFCGKKGLDIRGLSIATLTKLVEKDWIIRLSDIFMLKAYKDEWIRLPGFGVRSVENILDEIENKKENGVELWRFLSAIGIPNIGVANAKMIAKNVHTWDKFLHLVSIHHNFSSMEGIGDVLNRAILFFDYTEAISLATIVPILGDESSGLLLDEQQTLKGKTFAITGKLKQYKNRDELKNVIMTHGGKVTDSISTKVDYLINNDINSQTGKNKKAKELNIPIITEEKFLDILKNF